MTAAMRRPTTRDEARRDPTLESAFVQFMHEHEPAMARLARRYANGDEWHDLLQEMRLQLWRSFPAFEGRAQGSTWAYRVALNTALTHVRKPRPAHLRIDMVAEQGDSGDPRDVMHVLDDFLAMLDPIQRAVLVLDMEGLSREQIGEVTGLSPNAVAVRKSRLRQAFERQFMQEVP